jgi:hypothetical protein
VSSAIVAALSSLLLWFEGSVLFHMRVEADLYLVNDKRCKDVSAVFSYHRLNHAACTSCARTQHKAVQPKPGILTSTPSPSRIPRPSACAARRPRGLSWDECSLVQGAISVALRAGESSRYTRRWVAYSRSGINLGYGDVSIPSCMISIFADEGRDGVRRCRLARAWCCTSCAVNFWIRSALCRVCKCWFELFLLCLASREL